jgi:two-component system OmpR family sensor kinase
VTAAAPGAPVVHPDSIRRTLLRWLLAALAVGLCAAAAAVYLRARDDANELFDYHLRQVVASLPGRTFPAIGGDDTSLLEDGTVIQIWDASGSRLYFSHPSVQLPARAELGFATVEGRGGRWRVFSAIVGSNVVQAAQPVRVRQAIAADVALRTTLPFLILFPLLGVAIVFTVRRGLAPLATLAGDVGRRTARSLAPVPEAGVPEEVRPLVQALNGLLGRLGQALAAQRDFIADAAHELRTPLAALKLQMQLVGRAQGEADRRAALADLEKGLDRAARLVEQLLTLARQDPGHEGVRRGPCDLAALARDAVATRAPIGAQRGIDLGLSHQEATLILGDAMALAVLINNLVDNALRYTPEGGLVDVATRHDGDACVLEVADSGPGIAPAERARVFDRFYRVPGSPGTGSGLGLAIVRSVAEAHGATVELADRDGGGLRVQVRFPLLQQSDAMTVAAATS